MDTSRQTTPISRVKGCDSKSQFHVYTISKEGLGIQCTRDHCIAMIGGGDKTKLHFYNEKSSINLLDVVGEHIIVQFFPPQRVSILEKCNAHLCRCSVFQNAHFLFIF
jgi:hypothetical protein